MNLCGPFCCEIMPLFIGLGLGFQKKLPALAWGRWKRVCYYDLLQMRNVKNCLFGFGLIMIFWTKNKIKEKKTVLKDKTK